MDRSTWLSAVERLRTAILSGRSDPLPASRPGMVFVLGVGRSGTTWLQRMLLASPELGGPDGIESMVFKHLELLWDQRAAFAETCGEEQLVHAISVFCDTVFGAALERYPAAGRLVEKTPRHSILVPLVSRVYPDAWFVYVVRDGRDVARSMVDVPFFGVRTLADGAKLWKRVDQARRRDVPTLRNCLTVRYEDALERPDEVLGDVLRAIGVQVDDRVREELARRSARRVSTHAGTAQPVGTDTWRHLPRRDLAPLYVEIGRELVRAGYATWPQLGAAAAHPAFWAYWWRRRRQYRASGTGQGVPAGWA